MCQNRRRKRLYEQTELCVCERKRDREGGRKGVREGGRESEREGGMKRREGKRTLKGSDLLPPSKPYLLVFPPLNTTIEL